jgi:sec-independent protein translocase protein TatB
MNLGLPEIIVIAALILIFLGPKRMPEVMRSLGRAWTEILRAKDNVMAPLQDELEEATRSAGLSRTKDDLAAVRKEFEDGDP